MTGTWLDYVRALWPVVSGVSAALLVLIGLWLRSKFTPIDDHRALAVRVTEAESKAKAQSTEIEHVKTQLDVAPTRQELQDDISNLGSRMAGVETAIRGVDKRLETQNTYLHSLIEQGLRK